MSDTTGDFISIGSAHTRLDGPAVGRATIPVEALSRHACVFGMTGTGKSNCEAAICYQLALNSIPALVLDRAGEYGELLAPLRPLVLRPGENLKVAPFRLEERQGERMTVGDIEVEVVKMLSTVEHFFRACFRSEVSPLQRRVLEECLMQHYRGSTSTITVSKLVARLEEAKERNARLDGWPESIEAVISRLHPLTVGEMGRTFDEPYGNFDLQALLESPQRPTVVDLSTLTDDSSRTLLSQLILRCVNDSVRRMGKTPVVRVFVLIDEAQHVAPRGEDDYVSVPELIAMESRKYGLGLLMSATRPSLVSENVVSNSGTLISFMLNNLADIRRLTAYLEIDHTKDHFERAIRRLPTGFAYLQTNYPSPLAPVLCHVRRIAPAHEDDPSTPEEDALLGVAVDEPK